MSDGFKVVFVIVALVGFIVGIAAFAGWIICKADPVCATTIENAIDYYIWGIVPEWIVSGIWWGVGFGIPLWLLFTIWFLSKF